MSAEEWRLCNPSLEDSNHTFKGAHTLKGAG